eukprot:8747760-Alexandrium_andersonii.AAC.1
MKRPLKGHCAGQGGTRGHRPDAWGSQHKSSAGRERRPNSKMRRPPGALSSSPEPAPSQQDCRTS